MLRNIEYLNTFLDKQNNLVQLNLEIQPVLCEQLILNILKSLETKFIQKNIEVKQCSIQQSLQQKVLSNANLIEQCLNNFCRISFLNANNNS